MTYLVERAAELRRHLDHLRTLRPRVTREALDRELSLHNDVSDRLVTHRVIEVAQHDDGSWHVRRVRSGARERR